MFLKAKSGRVPLAFRLCLDLRCHMKPCFPISCCCLQLCWFSSPGCPYMSWKLQTPYPPTVWISRRCSNRLSQTHGLCKSNLFSHNSRSQKSESKVSIGWACLWGPDEEFLPCNSPSHQKLSSPWLVATPLWSLPLVSRSFPCVPLGLKSPSLSSYQITSCWIEGS